MTRAIWPAGLAILRREGLDTPPAATNPFDHIRDPFEDVVGVSASCFYLVAKNGRAFGHVLRGLAYTKLLA